MGPAGSLAQGLPALSDYAGHPCSYDQHVATFRSQHPDVPLAVLDDAASDRLDAYARTNLADRAIRLDRHAPCWALPSVLAHELAHVNQARAGLDQRAYALDPRRYELAADCTALRATSTDRPPLLHYLAAYRSTASGTARSYELTCHLLPATLTAPAGTVPPGA